MNTAISSYPRALPNAQKRDQSDGVNWKRLSVVTTAGALTGLALTRRNPIFLLAAAMGAIAGWKLMAPAEQPADMGTVELLVMEQMTRSMTINRSQTEVYSLMRNLQNIPLFLPPIKLVNDTGERGAVLTLKTWALTAIIDLHITSEMAGRSLAFDLLHAGNRFGHIRIKLERDVYRDGTIITASFRYHPLLGGLVNKALRPVMINEVDTYLMRLKQLAETGEIPRAK